MAVQHTVGKSWKSETKAYSHYDFFFLLNSKELQDKDAMAQQSTVHLLPLRGKHSLTEWEGPVLRANAGTDSFSYASTRILCYRWERRYGAELSQSHGMRHSYWHVICAVWIADRLIMLIPGARRTWFFLEAVSIGGHMIASLLSRRNNDVPN